MKEIKFSTTSICTSQLSITSSYRGRWAKLITANLESACQLDSVLVCSCAGLLVNYAGLLCYYADY
jgi:hypothetical protein